MISLHPICLLSIKFPVGNFPGLLALHLNDSMCRAMVQHKKSIIKLLKRSKSLESLEELVLSDYFDVEKQVIHNLTALA